MTEVNLNDPDCGSRQNLEEAKRECNILSMQYLFGDCFYCSRRRRFCCRYCGRKAIHARPLIPLPGSNSRKYWCVCDGSTTDDLLHPYAYSSPTQRAMVLCRPQPGPSTQQNKCLPLLPDTLTIVSDKVSGTATAAAAISTTTVLHAARRAGRKRRGDAET